MPRHIASLDPALRGVITAWVVCLAVAAACFIFIAVAPRFGIGPEALIGPGPAATVAAAEADRADAHRHGRC